MAIISRLAVLLGLDACEFNAGLGKAKSQVEGFGLGAKLSLAAVGTAFATAAQSAISFADKINDVSKANDMSVQSVLRMSQALSVNGGNTEDATKLMSAFSNKVDEAATGSDKAQKSFTQIGVSIKDLKTLTSEQLFEKTVKSLASIEDTTKRNAMAFQLLGRGIKGVDIKGLAKELDDNKNRFADSEQAFKSIGDSVDRLDRYVMNLKVDLANSLAPAFEYVTQAMEAHQARSKKILDRFAEIRKEAGWWAAFKDKEGLSKYVTASERSYGSVQDAGNISGALTGVGGIKGANKNIRDVQTADSIVKANEALDQLIQSYKLEADTIGQVKNAEALLNIEYQKGGKYYLATEEKKKKAIQDAIALDKARQAFEFKNIMEASQYEEKKLIIKQAYAFASEQEIQYQMDLLELDKKINDEKEKGFLLLKSEEDAYRQQEMDRIKRKKNIEDEQHTFEYGWQKAYKNYVRDATDASKNAEELFSTMAKGMEDALANFIKTGKLDFKSFADLVISEMARIQARMLASKILDFLGMGSAGSLLGGMFTGTTGEIGGSILLGTPKAGGGAINAPSLVGENGPEIFIPRTAGTILPNTRVNDMMGNQPQIVYNAPVIQNMSAIDTQSGLQFLAKNKQGVWAANQSAQRSLPQSR
jgi:lambda family phage tail tape measure protein